MMVMFFCPMLDVAKADGVNVVEKVIYVADAEDVDTESKMNAESVVNSESGDDGAQELRIWDF